ncbi:MAG: Asp-tRNA(Asn)/Glu-tRNA(Gln) amidotransferase subunit GatB [Planctomycetes bacterium]|nr:Asp-tRNA(Asn)/Glu-tRNA(Gln) amidotransferase subunit GatB [Planctomycetota bacterium]
MNAVPYEIVVGLEVHVQLLTRTKLFCRCDASFGAPPNTRTCPVCLGLPGALPVMNGRAFELALRTGIALDGEIPDRMKWDRKNYFYPDLPKGYQISQFDLPLARNGRLAIEGEHGDGPPRIIRIQRVHLEEDAGKSMHDEHEGRRDSRIDLNRAGTPLLEIVSEPDIRSAREAKAYLTELKLLLTYLDVSDCNMQEGSLRVDANVNLHVRPDASPHGSVIETPIVEIKNMNSFRAVERAIEYEVARQYDEWTATGATRATAPKQTRGWDDREEVTLAMRRKEESSDYRYFPEPDLLPVVVPRSRIDAVAAEMVERPAAIRERLGREWGLDAAAADLIVHQGRAFVAYFVDVARELGDPRRAANWMQQDVLRVLNERSMGIGRLAVAPGELVDLLRRVDRGELTRSRAKDVFQRMVETGRSAVDAMRAMGIESVDRSALEALCRELVDSNPRIVADVKAGKSQAIGALVGQAKRRNPNADPSEVLRICIELIGT